MNETEGRKRLALAVAADRGRIYRTVDAARIAAKVSRGTWDKVEAGERVKDFTLASVEEALGWPAGRARAIIDGRESEVPASSDAELRQVVLDDASLAPHYKRAILALLDAAATEGGRNDDQDDKGSATA